MSVLLGHTEPGLTGSLPAQLPGQLLPEGPVLLLPVLSMDNCLYKNDHASKFSCIAS